MGVTPFDLCLIGKISTDLMRIWFLINFMREALDEEV